MGAHPKEQDRVVVTGFGAFGVHKINASWVAVKELEKIGLTDPFVSLTTEEVKVDYEFVKVSTNVHPFLLTRTLF
jgi:pyroglutamyl-peptidase